MRTANRILLSAAIALGGLTAAVAPASAQSADEILRSFDGEPSILEVQRAASAHAQIDEGVIEGWTTRANTAALLPDVRVQYRTRAEDDLQNDDRQDYEVDPTLGEVLVDRERDERIEDDDEVTFLLQGDWNLNEIVWNPDIIRISDETRDLVELRSDILTTVTSLYFERRRAQVQLLMSPPSDAVERVRRELEIQELTAGIDALTGGWFSQQLSAAGLPTY